MADAMRPVDASEILSLPVARRCSNCDSRRTCPTLREMKNTRKLAAIRNVMCTTKCGKFVPDPVILVDDENDIIVLERFST